MTRDINEVPSARSGNGSSTRSVDDLKKIIAGMLETEGRTEAEIAAFQKKAAKMMHELGLSREEIMAKDPDIFHSTTQITRFDWIVTQLVFGPIMSLTGTKMWYEILPTPSGKRSDRKLVYFGGYRSDVDQATWLFQHVLEEAKKGAAGIKVTSERNSYLVGFGASVAKKIRDLAESLDTVRKERASDGEASVGTDVVLMEKERIVASFIESVAPDLVTTSNKDTSIRDGAAAGAGACDGKNVSLGRGVGQGAAALPSA